MMLQKRRHGSVLELQLARPPVNALDPELVVALRTEIAQARRDEACGIVISGSRGIYSGGFDVPALLRLNPPQLRSFLDEFFELCRSIAASPIPIAAAITGHSPAGGAVLTIFCDYRVMAASVDSTRPFLIGLNEVPVGLQVPDFVQFGLQRLIGFYKAERLMVGGLMLDAASALRVGLVDELVEIDQVVSRAVLWLEEILTLPLNAMSMTRQAARSDLVGTLSSRDDWNLAQFASTWFSTETQAILHSFAQRLNERKATRTVS